MSARLAGFVTLVDSNRRHVTFGPQDEVPEWAAKKITNPGAWAVGDDEGDQTLPPFDPIVPETPRFDPNGAGGVENPPDDLDLDDDGDGDGDGDGDEDDLEPPPHGGAGSGGQAWRDYAAAKDVQVDEEATRDEVVAACRSAGVRVD